MSRIAVYVAGPLTHGDTLANVRRACQAGAAVRARGFLEFVPHTSVLRDWIEADTYQAWLDWCLGWVKRCDALIRLPGESEGSDEEVRFARKLGKRVFVIGEHTGDLDDALDWLERCAFEASYAKEEGDRKRRLAAEYVGRVEKKVDGLRRRIDELDEKLPKWIASVEERARQADEKASLAIRDGNDLRAEVATLVADSMSGAVHVEPGVGPIVAPTAAVDLGRFASPAPPGAGGGGGGS